MRLAFSAPAPDGGILDWPVIPGQATNVRSALHASPRDPLGHVPESASSLKGRVDNNRRQDRTAFVSAACKNRGSDNTPFTCQQAPRASRRVLHKTYATRAVSWTSKDEKKVRGEYIVVMPAVGGRYPHRG